MTKKIIFLILGIYLVFSPVSVSAQLPENPPVDQKDFCPVGSNDKIRVPCIFTGADAQGPAGAGTKDNPRTFGQIVITIINIALAIVGSFAVIMLILAGFRYVFAAGNEERAEMAKKTIWHALLGLAIVLMSFAIVALVSRFLITGTPF